MEDDLGLVDALVQLSFSVQAVLGEAARRHDLTVAQLRLLGILRDRTPTMLELARFLRLEKSSVTGLVDRAERRGLVARAAAEHDGRAVQVSLTDAGRRLAADLEASIAPDLGTVVRPLGAREQAQLSRLASRVVTA
jgi:DNA-binding MarR family transcriptional regulator